MKRKTYPSDLSDEQWKLLETMLPPAERRGRKRRVCLRQVLNALRYILRTGCAWRYLPSEYPNWTSVYYYFQKWRDSDWFAAVSDALRRRLRLQQGRDENPSAGIVDAQSVKTSNNERERVCRVAASVGGGTHVRVVVKESAVIKRLRKRLSNIRGVDLFGNDERDAQARQT